MKLLATGSSPLAQFSTTNPIDETKPQHGPSYYEQRAQMERY